MHTKSEEPDGLSHVSSGADPRRHLIRCGLFRARQDAWSVNGAAIQITIVRVRDLIDQIGRARGIFFALAIQRPDDRLRRSHADAMPVVKVFLHHHDDVLALPLRGLRIHVRIIEIADIARVSLSPAVLDQARTEAEIPAARCPGIFTLWFRIYKI